MIQTTSTMTSKLSHAGAALLIASFGVACGTGGGDRGNPTDGGTASDGRDTADTGSKMDGRNATDVESRPDRGTPGDARDDAQSADASKDSNASDEGNTSPLPVDLGAAGNFVILAKSAISTVPTSAVTGDVGISPAAASYITGFSLTADPTNVFSTSLQVTGKVYAANFTPPTPSNLTTAVSDMQVAFTDAAGRPASVTGLGAGDIGGMTLKSGVYKWGTGLNIPTNVTLSGNTTDVWILQIAKSLTVSNATQVFLTGGAVPKNVFWQVSGDVTLGTTAHLEGVILGQTMISLKTGASINGRLLAQTAVSIESSVIVEPAP